MTAPTNQRRRHRVGVVFLALAAIVVALAPYGGSGSPGEYVVGVAVLAILAATGIGLLFDARPARIGGAAVLAIVAVVEVVGLVKMLVTRLPHITWELQQSLALANALASTVLLLWLQARAIQVLLDRPLRGGAITARIAGGALAIIAASHLSLTLAYGFAWDGLEGSWALTISTSGTQLFGFPGWPVWHAALLAVACALLLGRGRLLRLAATSAMVLFALLFPLVLYTTMQSPFPSPFDLAPVLLSAVLGLVPAYLFWWLRSEIAIAEPAG